jgi:hypothetical protein
MLTWQFSFGKSYFHLNPELVSPSIRVTNYLKRSKSFPVQKSKRSKTFPKSYSQEKI